MARVSNTVLDKIGESGHPCLLPHHRGNAFSFSLLNMLLVVGLSCMAFIKMIRPPTEWDKVFVNDMTDKRFISKIYKQLI